MAGVALTQADEQVPLIPQIIAYVILGNQTAAIGSTLLLANAPRGVYRACCSMVLTAAGTSGSLTANVIYTDSAKAETVAIASFIAITSVGQGQATAIFENTAVANINYSVVAGGTLSPGSFNLYIILERIF